MSIRSLKTTTAVSFEIEQLMQKYFVHLFVGTALLKEDPGSNTAAIGGGAGAGVAVLVILVVIVVVIVLRRR